MKIVITGGPYSGKTTLIEELEDRGCNVLHEAAIELIKELNDKFGVAGQKAWREKHFSEFQEMIAKAVTD